MPEPSAIDPPTTAQAASAVAPATLVAPTLAAGATVLTAALAERWSGGLAAGLSAGWAVLWTGENRRFTIAVASAFAVHALILLISTGALSIVLPGWFADSEQQTVGVGDPAGLRDGVNVETIDAAEFDKRYLSFTTGRDSTDTEPVEGSQSAPTPAPPPKAELTPPTPPEAVAPAPVPPPPARSAADIAEIMSASRLDADRVVQMTSKASDPRLGQASEFVKTVLRRLKQTMPRPRNMMGTVIVQFIVSDTGDIEMIRLAQSSRNAELDRLVIERIRTTRLIAPDKTTPPRDRAFQITYEFY